MFCRLVLDVQSSCTQGEAKTSSPWCQDSNPQSFVTNESKIAKLEKIDRTTTTRRYTNTRKATIKQHHICCNGTCNHPVLRNGLPIPISKDGEDDESGAQISPYTEYDWFENALLVINTHKINSIILISNVKPMVLQHESMVLPCCCSSSPHITGICWTPLHSIWSFLVYVCSRVFFSALPSVHAYRSLSLTLLPSIVGPEQRGTSLFTSFLTSSLLSASFFVYLTSWIWTSTCLRRVFSGCALVIAMPAAKLTRY